MATFADSHDFFRSATCDDDAGCSKGAKSSFEGAIKFELTIAKKGATESNKYESDNDNGGLKPWV